MILREVKYFLVGNDREKVAKNKVKRFVLRLFVAVVRFFLKISFSSKATVTVHSFGECVLPDGPG